SSVHVGGVVRDFGWRLQPSVVARARRWTRLRIETTFCLPWREGEFSRGCPPIYGARRLGGGAAYCRTMRRAKINEGDDAALRGQAERSRNIVAIRGRARAPDCAKPKGVGREKNILGRSAARQDLLDFGHAGVRDRDDGHDQQGWRPQGFAPFAVEGFQRRVRLARTQGRGHHVAKQLARCAAHDEKPPRLQPAMIRSPRAGAQKYLPLRIRRSWVRQSRHADPRVDGFKSVHRIPRSSDWLF